MEVNDLGIKGMETLPLVVEYLYDVATSCVCCTSAIRKHLLIITIVYLYFLPVLISIFGIAST